MERTPAIYMADIYRVIVFADKGLNDVIKVSDYFVEDYEGAYAYAKKCKHATVVKAQATFNTFEEE